MKRNSSVSAEYADKLGALRRQCEEKENLLGRQMIEVTDFIGQLESSSQQLVFTKRYIQHKTWEQIARELDMGVRLVQKHHGFAREHENEFVEMVMKKSQAELNKNQRDVKCEMEQSMQRIAKLDTIIQRLYEDNVEGKITDERFDRMSQDYELEQAQLQNRVKELKSILQNEKDESLNVNQFLSLVRKYTDVQELTAELIREFVEKVLVYQAEKVDGHRVQRIKIIWNCIGEFQAPEQGKAQPAEPSQVAAKTLPSEQTIELQEDEQEQRPVAQEQKTA